MVDRIRKALKGKKRVVVKIGSSSLQHAETGGLDYTKLDVLVRELCNMKNQGRDVVLVTSGAVAEGKRAVSIDKGDNPTAVKQACAAIGQARLMMVYQKIFAEYNQVSAQILMTKNTIVDDLNRYNAHNTFTELLKLGVIPIVNENDTIATYELGIGDNDSLSAIVAALIDADLLILLTDIDGLFTDNPKSNDKAEFIEFVERVDDSIMKMGKIDAGSTVGTGGMSTKLIAAKIATSAGADMIIANSKDIRILHRLLDGRNLGTLFMAHKDEDFDMRGFIEKMY